MARTSKSQKLRNKILKSSKIRRKERVGPAVSPSVAIELLYRQHLNTITERLVKATKVDMVRSNIDGAVFDAGPRAELNAMLARIRKEVIFIGKQSQDIAALVANRANLKHKDQFQKSMESQFGINMSNVIGKNDKVKTAMRNMTKMNARLITKMANSYKDQIEGIVQRSFTQGTSTKSLVNQIEDVLSQVGEEQDKIRNRAKLIARDQSAKFNLSLTQARHEDLGIEEYIWVTSGDERVRDEHRRNNGKKFRWDTPPPNTGHPGHDIQCRCTARPVINL